MIGPGRGTHHPSLDAANARWTRVEHNLLGFRGRGEREKMLRFRTGMKWTISFKLLHSFIAGRGSSNVLANLATFGLVAHSPSRGSLACRFRDRADPRPFDRPR
jgi:hypothetical protein